MGPRFKLQVSHSCRAQSLVRLTGEDVHVPPAPNQSPANTVHSGVGIGLGGLVVVAQRDDIGCAALIGGSEGLVAAKAN